MVVRQASIEDNPDDDTVQTAIPKSYLRAYHLVKLDSFVCTHGPSTKVDGESALCHCVGVCRGEAEFLGYKSLA